MSTRQKQIADRIVGDRISERLASQVMAVRTFKHMGREYPYDSKYAKIMAVGLGSPIEGIGGLQPEESSVMAWDATRKWAEKRKPSMEGMKALMTAYDYVRTPMRVSEVEGIWKRLRVD